MTQPPSSRELGYYFALMAIGSEMVFPMIVGIFLDYWLDWTPWATVIGLAVGAVGAMTHLVLMTRQHDAEERRPPGGAGGAT